MATLLADSDSTAQQPSSAVPDAVVVRFAGDSGDGMQLTGGQFTLSTALAGNDLATFPDFPALLAGHQAEITKLIAAMERPPTASAAATARGPVASPESL